MIFFKLNADFLPTVYQMLPNKMSPNKTVTGISAIFCRIPQFVCAINKSKAVILIQQIICMIFSPGKFFYVFIS